MRYRNKMFGTEKLKEIDGYKWHRKSKGSMITINESGKPEPISYDIQSIAIFKLDLM